MIAELRRSINGILYERTTSPLYGTFIVSWLVWNWKVVYLTLFIDEQTIKPMNKIDYIVTNFSDFWYLTIYPIVSTIALIGVIPALANQAYRAHLFYEKKRVKWKEEAEANRRMSLAQSAELRNEMVELETKYEKRLESKNRENRLLEEQIKQMTEAKIAAQGLKIMYAQYGKNDSYVDVTDRVASFVSRFQDFVIDNTNMGSDPVPGVVKEFLVVIWSNEVIKRLMAVEGEKIQIIKDSSKDAVSDIVKVKAPLVSVKRSGASSRVQKRDSFWKDEDPLSHL